MHIVKSLVAAGLPLVWAIQPSLACERLWMDAFGLRQAPCQTDISAPTGQERAQWSGLQNQAEARADWQAIWQKPQAVAQIDIMAGQKTLEAGKDKAMSVALLQDALGNAAADGTQATFQSLTSNTENTGAAASKNGLAIWVFNAPTKAETGYASAQSGAVQSKRSDFQIVSAETQSIVLTGPDSGSHPSQGQIELSATNLQDRFGNRKEDGTLVRFRGTDGADHRHFVQGLMANQAASAFPASMPQSPLAKWSAQLGMASSNVVVMPSQTQHLVNHTMLQLFAEQATQTLRLRAGPFTTLAGHRVIDGTAINFTLSHTQGDAQALTTPGRMVDGWAETIVTLPETESPLIISASLLDSVFIAVITEPASNAMVQMNREINAPLRGAS